MAVQRWGEPRLTQDVDVTLLTGFGGEDAYIDFLLALYPGRRNDSRIFALKNTGYSYYARQMASEWISLWRLCHLRKPA